MAEPRGSKIPGPHPGVEHIPINVRLHITALSHFTSDAYGYNISLKLRDPCWEVFKRPCLSNMNKDFSKRLPIMIVWTVGDGGC